jgi:dihydropteroate synthase
LVATGWPVMVGTSRKSFLGSAALRPGETQLPVAERLEGTVATSAWAVLQGAAMVRVHDVRPALMAARLAAAVPPAGGTR